MFLVDVDILCRKYNFKGKKRKLTDDDEDRELAESVRTISALFQAGNSIPDEPLEMRVASISAEIAAAIAQVQSRAYEDEEEEESGSGQEVGGIETIGPNTSGIRGEGATFLTETGDLQSFSEPGDDGEDSDAFPAPLHTRKQLALSGNKRKR